MCATTASGATSRVRAEGKAPQPAGGVIEIAALARGCNSRIAVRKGDMFREKEEATHTRAAEVMRELGWGARA